MISSDRGFGMVEVLVALALTGLAGTCFLSSLTTVSRSTITADERSTAESLGTSQMEYILSQDYDDTNNPPQYEQLTDIPYGWSVNFTAERLDPDNDGMDDDDGIQEISVITDSVDEEVFTIISRKVNLEYVP